MKDYRRLNVAVTRARRQCTLIGDSETLNSDALLQRLVSYFSEQGEHWSAQEFLPDVRFYSAPPPKKNANNNTKKKKNKKKPAAKAQNESKPSANNSTANSTNSNAKNSNSEAKNTAVSNTSSASHVPERTQPVAQDVNVTPVTATAVPEVTPVAEEMPSDDETEASATTNSTANTAAKKKKKKKKPANKPASTNTAAKKDKLTNEKESFANLTDDEVLEQALKYKNVCHYPQCDKSVAIVGSVCDHCHFKYCYVSTCSPVRSTLIPRTDALPLRDTRLWRGSTRISAQRVAESAEQQKQAQVQRVAG